MKLDNGGLRSMRREGISLEEAVERVYAEAIRQTAQALQAGEVGEPYRWLTYALQSAYPDLIAHAETRLLEHAAPARADDDQSVSDDVAMALAS
jgi:hypothetical protein